MRIKTIVQLLLVVLKIEKVVVVVELTAEMQIRYFFRARFILNKLSEFCSIAKARYSETVKQNKR